MYMINDDVSDIKVAGKSTKARLWLLLRQTALDPHALEAQADNGLLQLPEPQTCQAQLLGLNSGV